MCQYLICCQFPEMTKCYLPLKLVAIKVKYIYLHFYCILIQLYKGRKGHFLHKIDDTSVVYIKMGIMKNKHKRIELTQKNNCTK